MKYKISNIKISIEDFKEENLIQYISERLKLQSESISGFFISSKSVDARKSQQGEVFILYSVVFQYPEEIKQKTKWDIITLVDSKHLGEPQAHKKRTLDYRPVLVGFGPAGIFAALKFAEYGLKPIVLERGKDVDSRKIDIENFWKNRVLAETSNVQFGEGGAGTFSDGKLTTRVKDPICDEILQYFVDAGAPEEIKYLNKPHVGTDNLRKVIKNIRKRIIELGGQVLFESQVTDILIENNQVVGVEVNHSRQYQTNHVILATGHSARDTYEMIIKKGIHVETKGFAIGLRIEHPQKKLNEIQYGNYANHPSLKAADYQLAFKDMENNRGVYSFCMCPGGVVVAASSEKESVVTNGMSYYSRDLQNANSAIVVNINPGDFDNDPLKGIAFQRKYEKLAFELGGKNYNAPIQLVGDFLAAKASTGIGEVTPSYQPGVTPTDLSFALPNYVIKSIRNSLPYFDNKLKGFAIHDAVLTGVETRTSSPLRILRDKTSRESVNVKGFYPVGEGAGYAGGIMSAALDGLRTAYCIIAESCS